MAFQEKLLAQKRENTTGAVSVFSPEAGVTAVIKTIMIANTSGAAATVRVFIDDDGSIFDESTALIWDKSIATGDFLQITGFFAMDDSTGNLGYRSSVANSLVITVFGAEIN